jgi:uncharacterized metal-binding protein YceD (DUF177 family)
MINPEFSRRIALEQITERGLKLHAAAHADECQSLAQRFDLLALDSLDADVCLTPQGQDVVLTGTLRAQLVYRCRVTSKPLPAKVEEAINLVYKASEAKTAEHAHGANVAGLEIELDAQDLDVEWLDPQGIDVGEAIAQTLSLALDPYPRAEDADQALSALGILTQEQARRTPFAVLKGLKN